MKNIAYIGLGVMGRPMATNLLKAGYNVTGFNRSPHKTELFVQAGGTGASSIAQAVENADIVFTNVPDAPDVADVLTGDGGVLAHARPGTFWVDNSTISTVATKELAAAAITAGLRPADAPVSGGEIGAINGSLSVMVGATSEDFAALRPVLEAMGSTVIHVGESGSGQTVKAANQMIVAGNLQLLAEAFNFLESSNVDTASALAALGGGLAGSNVMHHKSKNLQERDFTPGFTLELHHKDLGIALAAARETGAFTPLAAMVGQLLAAAVAQGDGHLDHSALLKNVIKLSQRD